MSRQHLSVINPQPRRLPGPSLLHNLLAPASDNQALEHLSDTGERSRCTYTQLHAASDRIAHKIQEASEQTDTQQIIPLLLTQTPLLYATLLGILKAGAAFCPLNVDAPTERIKFILQDVAATVVVVSPDLRDKLPEVDGVEILTLTEDEFADAGHDPYQPTRPCGGLAYVMYTSGSTGVPKGVALSHDAATQALMAHDEHIPIFERFLQFAAPTFDVSVFEIFFPLIRGKTLISVDRQLMLNDLPAALNEMQVDACELTPSVAAGLLRSRDMAPGLKLLLTIGEMLNVSVVNEFGGSEHRESMLWAMYGPTEATIHCTLKTSFDSTSPVGMIGEPLATVSCFVADTETPLTSQGHLNILPRGEVGELVVGGHQLADGYLNRPEKTTEAFIDCATYGRVYRTGDRAKVNEDGLLECLGRLADGQVKLRGQRIELGEIEHAMLRAEGCHVIVAAVIDGILVGFCVANDDSLEAEILKTCREWLTPNMIPSEIVIMPDFPRLPSGKVDKAKLKTDYAGRLVNQESAASSNQDSVDIAVLAAISTISQNEATLQHTLSSLGISSLLAIQLASELRKRGHVISVADILRLRTVSDLCHHLRHAAPPLVTEETAPLRISIRGSLENILEEVKDLPLQPEDIEDIFPCTALQIAMLSATKQDEWSYVNDICFVGDGSLEIHNLEEAFLRIVAENEILRTSFIEWDGSFVSIVAKKPREGLIHSQSNGSLPDGIMTQPLSLYEPLQIAIDSYSSFGESTTRVRLRIHHAAYDGWSMDAILYDLNAILAGEELVPRPPFHEVTRHFSSIDMSPRSESLTYWADHLAGWERTPFPKMLEAPSSPPSIEGGVHYRVEISRQTIDDALRATGCSKPSFLIAATSIVWKGILGASDVVIGNVSSGRTLPLPGIENILGPCMASLPLRANHEGLETVDQLVKSIEKANRQAMQHSSVSHPEIRQAAGLQSWESLYDVLFAYQQSIYSDPNKHSLLKESGHLDRLETSLLLEAAPTEYGFILDGTCRTDVLDADVVVNILQQIGTVTLTLMQNCKKSLHDLGANYGCTKQNSAFGIEPLHLGQTPDLGISFQSVAEKQPEAIAIDFARPGANGFSDRQSITFKQLNERANQAARDLIRRGAHQGDVVAIVMEKSVELYVGILAIAKAGCAYLPLLPTTPTNRIDEVFDQAGISHCFVDRPSDPISSKQGVVYLHPDDGITSTLPSHDLNIPPNGDRLSYVIFTSGTTGRPKGVAVTQANITSNIAFLRKKYPVSSSSQDRLLQACSQAFDVSVFEIFFTWLSGMRICTGTQDTIFSDLEHACRTFEITHLSLTPTVAALIDPKNAPSLRFLVTAGEALTRGVLDKFGNMLWQGYGPSETTNICTVKQMSREHNIEHLGYVLPNTSVVVLGANSLEPLPIGWAGELCFGGYQVAQGYLNAPQLTAEKFIDHPRYGRLYRSGDLGRMLPDGTLVTMGRMDDQIKMRGQRIEPAEIDRVMTIHGKIAAAATLLVTVDTNGGPSQSLVTFWTTDAAKSDDKVIVADVAHDVLSELIVAVKFRLPAYMVPSYLIPVSCIPRTSSGKTDRPQLITLFHSLSKEYLETAATTTWDGDDASEWTDLETAIRDTIASSASYPASKIGRWTSFSTLGIDSISAIKAARYLMQALGKQVTISALLMNNCVALLSRHIEKETSAKSEVVEANDTLVSQETFDLVQKRFLGDASKVVKVLPCLPLQEAMLARGRSYYNHVLFKLSIDPTVVKSTWEKIVKRHDILRTCFITTQDQNNAVVQVVLENHSRAWKNFSHMESTDDAKREHLDNLPDPVDSRIPPVSMGVISSADQMFLSFACHHALYDGAAMDLLWEEMEDDIKGCDLTAPPPFEPFLRKVKTTPTESNEFWLSQLHDFAPARCFSSLSPGKPSQTTYVTSLPIAYSDLQRRTKELGVSMLALAQAAWARTLAITNGREDVCFGNVVSGRAVDVPDVERLVAPCFNTLPVRLVLDTSLQNVQLLKDLTTINRKMLPYQFTPLRDIRRLLGLLDQPLFETLLLVQPPECERDNSIWEVIEDEGQMDVPIVCELIPNPKANSVKVALHYLSDSLEELEAKTTASGFVEIVKNIIHAPFDNVSITPVFGIDRIRVPELNPKPEDNGLGATVGAWSDLENAVRGVFSTLAKVEVSSIQKSTTIHRLGLDSINAVQVASMLRDQGFSLSAADVQECATCETLARRIADNGAVSRDVSDAETYDFERFSVAVKEQALAGVPNGLKVEAILPCSPVQCAMAASAIHSGGCSYVNLVKYKIDPGYSYEKIRLAWDRVRHQHSLLRSAIARVDHPDATFAMLQYSAEGLEPPIEQWSTAPETSQLRTVCARELIGNEFLPPWRVILHTEDSGVAMYLVIHHALYDAWSLQAVLENLSRALQDLPLAAVRSPIAGLSHALIQSGKDGSEAATFWKGLASKAVVNRFPVLTSLREDDISVSTTSIRSEMSFSDLQNRSGALGVSVQTVIEATWTRILAAYTGEDSVVFGVTLSDRLEDNTQDTPIPSLTTMPVVAGNAISKSDLLQSLQTFDLNLAKHRRSALGQVQSWLGHPGSPVFDTLITYQGRERPAETYRPFRIVEEVGEVDFPVSLEIEPKIDDTVVLSLTSQKKIMPSEQANIILKQFDAILMDLLRQDTHRNVETSTRPDIYSILPAELPEIATTTRCLHEFVEQRASENSLVIALDYAKDLESPSATWTYPQLNDNGNRVSALVREIASPKTIVAIHFSKCPEAYFSILGILKSGCAFVALDPAMPPSRKEFIVKDSGAKCLLTHQDDSIDFEPGVPILRIDVRRLHTVAPAAESIDVDPQDTCYCLYTSGTTGTPKGCELTHENAVQAMLAFQEVFKGRWASDSRWLQFAALHFDVSVLEQYWTWSVGITMVACPRDVVLDDLSGAITKLNITHIDLTPSLARLLDPEDVPSLWNGVFITGGESLKQEILDKWGPKGVIHNAYGPTEATIGVTTYAGVPQRGRPSNIGRQFLNVGSYVLQPGTAVPVLRGGVGELCVAGKLVGKGYLNRPDLTDKSFPYLEELGERVYRTGDLVRVLADGCFDFIGRADDQVKLRGQRLEIGEINHAIREGVPEISDVATVVVTEKSKDRSLLVSFIVGESHAEQPLEILADEDGLGHKARAASRAKLPGYMVPTYFLKLPHIPLSINNKAELKVLKQLFEAIPPSDLVALNASVNRPPAHSELLPKVRAALSTFASTPCDELPSSTNVFDIGVDSITVLRFVSALKAQGLDKCSSATILQNPIIGDLAAILDSKTGSDRKIDLVSDAKMKMKACAQSQRKAVQDILGISESETEYILPCSPLQEGMVSAALTRGLYFVSLELTIAEGVDLQKLQAAWDTLVERYAILRTAFLNTPDGCIQVAKRKALAWSTAETMEERTLRKEAWITGNSEHIFEPLQLTLLNTERRRLYIDIFHGSYDGASLDTMLNAVKRLYNGGKLDKVPSFRTALAHGPLWRHDFSKDFWLQHLTGWTPQAIWPSKMTQKPHQKSISVSTSMTLDADQVANLLKKYRVTMQSLLLAIWTTVLENENSSTAVGVIVSGRSIDIENVDGIVGPLFNTLAFSPQACRDDSLSGLVQYCQSFVTSILDFQHVPLKSVQRWCSNGQSLFNNLFTIQVESRQEDPALFKLEDSEADLDYPLAFEATLQVSGNVELKLVADEACMTESQLQETLQSFEAQLKLFEETTSATWKREVSRSASPDSSPGIATPTSSMDSETFDWTSSARAIRQELAALSQTAEDAISSSTTVLQLGLDSIDVLKLSSRLKRRGIDVSASKILRHQHIEGLLRFENINASKIEHSQAMDKLSGVRDALKSSISPGDAVEAVYPATPLQEGMVMGMIQSNFEYYYNHEVLELGPTINVDRLREAWMRIVSQNDILRTAFVEVPDCGVDSSFAQVVYKPSNFRPSIHKSTAPNALIRAALEAARSENGKNSLLQVAFTTQGEKKLMIISIAHALYDGWSLGLLYQDLRHAYESAEVPRRPAWDAYLAERALVDEKESERFWKGFLNQARATIVASPGPAPAGSDGVTREELTSQHQMSHVLMFCKRHALSLQALCYAAWSVYVAHSARQLDVTFGVVLSGRDFDGAEDLMFPTMNTIIHRAILHGTSLSFMEYVERNLQDIRQHQTYPLRKAQRLAAREGDLFDTIFMLQRSPGGENSNDMFKSVEGTSRVDYPLAVEAEVVGETLVWRVAAQNAVWDANRVGGILQSLNEILGYLLENPDEPLLHSSGDGHSICGLAPITIVDGTSHAGGELIEGDESFDWTDEAKIIRQVFSTVSRVPEKDIKPGNTIYHLGLDSISVVKVSSLLRKHGVFLKGRDLTGPSIADMAQTLQAVTTENENPTAPNHGPVTWTPPSSLDMRGLGARYGIDPGDVEAYLPVNAMQTYMLGSWFASEGAICYPEFKFRLPSSITREQVDLAWAQLMKEMPILRTRFMSTEQAHLPFVQVILGQESNQSTGAWASCYAEERQGEGGVLHLKIHHALYDAFSLPVIANRLLQLVRDPQVEVTALETGPWARKVIQPTMRSSREAGREFWTEYLAGATKRPRSGSSSGKDRTSLIRRGVVSSENLRSAAAQQGVSAQALFLASYAHYISRRRQHEPAEPVVFGVYLANRDVDTSAVAPYYPTLSVVPVKVSVGPASRLTDTALAIQRDLREIQGGHAEHGLMDIYEWTGVRLDSVVNFVAREQAVEDEVKPADDAVPDLGDEGRQLGALRVSAQLAKDMREVFSDIVEVEASVDQGGLTMGAFGSERRITEDDAAGIIDGVGAMLKEHVGESRR